jgi:predicted RNase H-like HicB family nuclease
LRYEVKLLKSEEGYAVWCPALPGCWSQGDTETEALENIRDAIGEYLSVAEDLDSLARTETRSVEVG